MFDLRVFSGAVALSVSLGSLHAFGVLVVPLEKALAVGRGVVSLAYSVAIAALTLAVFVSPWIRVRAAARHVAIFIGVLGGLGLAIAAQFMHPAALILGYGLCFGFANGLGYSLFLERAAAAMPNSAGIATGAVTATYGAGAMVFSVVLGRLAAQVSAAHALLILAACVAVGAIAAAILFLTERRNARQGTSDRRGSVPGAQWVLTMWVIYFLGAAAGLMAIAHASAFIASLEHSTGWVASATTIISAGNMIGCIGGGYLADRFSARPAIAVPIAVLAAVLWLLWLGSSVASALILLACAGAAYGALISAVPSVILKRAGAADSPAVFGRVFTAWGVAGLVGPVIAGFLFDATGHYGISLMSAAAAATVGAALALLMQTRTGAQFPASHGPTPLL